MSTDITAFLQEEGDPMEYIVKETDYLLATRQEVIGELIRCKDCKYFKDSDECFFSTAVTSDDGFCHWAERRTDEAD